MISRCEICSEDLCEVSPFREKDHDKRCDQCLTVCPQLGGDEFFLVFLNFRLFARLMNRKHCANEEHGRNDCVDRAVRKDMEERDPDGDSDRDMDHERGCSPEPDDARSSLSRQNKRGKHRLVGKFADENNGEHRDHDRYMHAVCGVALRARVELGECLERSQLGGTRNEKHNVQHGNTLGPRPHGRMVVCRSCPWLRGSARTFR